MATLEGSRGNAAECLTADGRYLASVTMEGSIRLWDVVTGKLLTERAGIRRRGQTSHTATATAGCPSDGGSGGAVETDARDVVRRDSTVPTSPSTPATMAEPLAVVPADALLSTAEATHHGGGEADAANICRVVSVGTEQQSGENGETSATSSTIQSDG